MNTSSLQDTKSTSSIRVCTGPGCASWGSKNLLQKLQDTFSSPLGEGRRVCSSRCLNRCGGGATVVVGSSKRQVFKWKESVQAVSGLVASISSLV